MNIRFLFVVFLFSHTVFAQNAIRFDSITNGNVFFSDNYAYLVADDIVKMDVGFNPFASLHRNADVRGVRVVNDEMYIWSDTTIFKLNSSFGLIWSVQLGAMPFPCQSFPYHIEDIIISDDRLFIINFLTSSFDQYLSVLTLDTAGAYINHTCETVQVYWQALGIADDSGTCWLSTLDPSPVQHTGTIHLDRQGLRDTTPGMVFNASAQNDLIAVLRRSDSDRVYISNGFFEGYHINLVLRVNQSNTVVNQFAYLTDAHDAPYISSVALDNADQLYLLASDLESNQILFKTDQNGQVVRSKIWSQTAISSMQLDFFNAKLLSRNDTLFVKCKINGATSLIVIDSTLNSFCYGPDSLFGMRDTAVNRSFMAAAYSPYQVPFTIVPYQPLLQNGALPAVTYNCFFTNVPVIQKEHLSFFYPNPASDIVFLTNGLSDWILTDSYGRRIKSGRSESIDVEELASGVYFIIMDNRAGVLFK